MSLDAAAFPHIFRAIVDHSSHNTLLAFRLVSHWARDAAEARLFFNIEVIQTQWIRRRNVKGTYDYPLSLERLGFALPCLMINAKPLWRASPGGVEPDLADAAARATWVRVLQHTHVVGSHGMRVDFPPRLHDSNSPMALPVLRIQRDFRLEDWLPSLTLPIQVDLWHTRSQNKDYHQPIPTHVYSGPPEAARHVIAVLCNLEHGNELYGLTHYPVIEFPSCNTPPPHLVIIFLRLGEDNGTEVLEPTNTFLFTFLRAIASLEHQRYTVVGLEKLPPRFMGLPAHIRADDVASRLPDAFLDMACKAWNEPPSSSYPESHGEVLPETLRGRVRVLTHEEWCQEIGREEYDTETFGAEDMDLGDVISLKELRGGLEQEEFDDSDSD